MPDMATEIKDSRQFVVILLIVFFGFLGISIPYLIFPSLFLNPEHGLIPATWSGESRALMLGVTLAAYPFGQFLGSPILGALSDEYGRKWLLVLSLIIAGACNMLTAIALEHQLLFLVVMSRFATGFMEGNVAIARAMAADLKTMVKHRSFGRMNAVISIAYFAGPPLGALLFGPAPFYLIGTMFFVTAILSAVLLTSSPPARAKRSALTANVVIKHFNLLARMAILLKDKRLKFLLLISTLFTIAVDIFFEFGPVHLTTAFLLEPVELIRFNSAMCLCLAIGSSFFSLWIAKRYSNQRGIIIAMSALTAALASLVVATHFQVLILLFGVCGLAIAIGSTLTTVEISDTVSDAIQGEVMGVQQALRVLTDTFICLGGGLLLLLSSHAILILAAVIAAFTTIYFAVKCKTLGFVI